jgi:hypothetical protein
VEQSDLARELRPRGTQGLDRNWLARLLGLEQVLVEAPLRLGHSVVVARWFLVGYAWCHECRFTP